MEAAVEASEGLFQWTKQWYPLAVVAHLDAAKPHSLQLLGRDLVLWCAGPLLGLAARGLQRFSGLFQAYGFEHAQND